MFLDTLAREARKSDMHQKHGAAIVCGSSLISLGHNTSLFDTTTLEHSIQQRCHSEPFKLSKGHRIKGN
jgi:hypothetical protein